MSMDYKPQVCLPWDLLFVQLQISVSEWRGCLGGAPNIHGNFKSDRCLGGEEIPHTVTGVCLFGNIEKKVPGADHGQYTQVDCKRS